ncbi:hypothetical protein [Kordiimonas marina]|uniref:hypothetical protein n=1 Tax=Kordiimonas marina TaxID=2872312 RepID=UPI001FF44944|nr:hypothetical protein [Kordiimonas marina]MCJ9429491.1 hypothetical protein [Kordiimonas marina]
MNRLLATTVLTLFASSALSVSASAQNGSNGSVSEEHKPNAATMACLEAPTRDCAFSAALHTVIGEDFGVERAKVLIGVARSMIETGKDKEALQTLKLALDEARAVHLSLVTQEKIRSIAPLMSTAGDVAGALALTQELTNENVRDGVLIHIAAGAYKRGDIAAGRLALKEMQNRGRAFWQELTLLTEAPKAALAHVKLADLEKKVSAMARPYRHYRGLVQLAIIADRMGNPGDRNQYLAQADDLFPTVIGLQVRADVTAFRLRNMFDAGMSDSFIDASYKLALLHGSRLHAKSELASFSEKVGPVEAARGNLDAALKRLSYFKAVDAKAQYLASLKASKDESILAAQVREVLTEVKDVQGAYERDGIRLDLLECAFANKDIQLARTIVEAMEDDDNQALGLAVMAPMLD